MTFFWLHQRMCKASYCAPAASPEEAKTGSTSFGSFRQLLTSALPSEVQHTPEPPVHVSQSSRENTRNKGPPAEPPEMSALEALQIERARIHGTLVSYLHSGWERDAGSRSDVPESTQWRAAQSRIESNEVHSLSGDSKHNRDIRGRQRQHVKGADRPPRSTFQALHADEGQVGSPIPELAAAPGISQPLSSRPVAHSSRRAEAMALLEGGGHSSSAGYVLRVLCTAHYIAGRVCADGNLYIPYKQLPYVCAPLPQVCELHWPSFQNLLEPLTILLCWTNLHLMMLAEAATYNVHSAENSRYP